METIKTIDTFLKDVTTPARATIDYIEDGQRYVGNGIIIAAISDKTSTSREFCAGVATKLVNNAMTQTTGNHVNVDVNKLLKASRYMKAASGSDKSINLTMQPDGFKLSNNANDVVTAGQLDSDNFSGIYTTVDVKLLVAVMTMEKRLGSKKVRLELVNDNMLAISGKATTLIAIIKYY